MINGNRRTFVGDKFKLNCGSIATIIEYNSIEDIKIRTNLGYETTVQKTQLKLGNVKDPFCKTKFEIGFLGSIYLKGLYSKDSISCWDRMLTRCYSESYLKKQPTYINCMVSKEWLNFTNFNNWHVKNYKNGFVLDKDLRVFGNKLYSEKTCVFIPKVINNFFFKQSKKDSLLPFGVLYTPRSNKKRFKSSISTESFDSILKAKNNYWNKKLHKMELLTIQFPDFKKLLENYFESFFGENYG